MRNDKCGFRRAGFTGATLAVTLVFLLGSATPAAFTFPRETRLTQERRILHVLNRITFGPRSGDVERLRQLGIERFIEQQLRPESLADSEIDARLSGIDSLRMTAAQRFEKYPQADMVARRLGLDAGNRDPSGQGGAGEPDRGEVQRRRQELARYYSEQGLRPTIAVLQELQAQKVIRAVHSERQLQEVMVDFWFNHFNVFWGKGIARWMTTSYEMEAIRPHVLGKFRDLVAATAASPAMLFYLDNFQSSSPNMQLPGRRLNDRGRRGPARFQRPGGQDRMMPEDEEARRMAARLRNRQPGINENYARELLELHTLGVDGGYTQKDVQEVARAFTGWTIDRPQQGGGFVFRRFMHDDGEKVVLGHRIPPGGGIKDGERVIDILVKHPSTARFISEKLVRRFVSDDPSPGLVSRVAEVYKRSDGDIREMLRAIFRSPEFNSPEAYRVKIKSPFELAVSAIRALGGETSGGTGIAQFISRMGQPLYMCQAPTGYPDRAEQWVSAGSLLERLNFGLAVAANRVPGANVNPSALLSADAGSEEMLRQAISILLNGDVSDATKDALMKQLREGVRPAPDGGRGRLGRGGEMAGGPSSLAVGLVLGAPEFQRR